MSNWMVRDNTFESPRVIAPDRGSNGTRWIGNLGAWDCTPGITYRYNVGHKCGPRQGRQPALLLSDHNRRRTAG